MDVMFYAAQTDCVQTSQIRAIWTSLCADGLHPVSLMRNLYIQYLVSNHSYVQGLQQPAATTPLPPPIGKLTTVVVGRSTQK